jgi:AcrR family transcriptional regulator
MLTAMIQVASERGAGNVTVAQVVGRAGVSRRTFYEVFDDCEECLLTAFEVTLDRAAARVIPAYQKPGGWREKMRASLTALLQLLDQEPDVARLLVVETLAAGPRALERRQRALAPVAAAVALGAMESNGRASGPLAAEAIVGAVLSIVHDRLLAPEHGPLVELVNPLMSTIVLPYLGAAAARRELDRPVAKTCAREARARVNPLKDLDIRLTYRTVRALSAVAVNPRASNRAIADASGISDQGQVSKLLGRLERLGLIENASIGAVARGEPNAWKLTEMGGEVYGSISAQRAAPV